MDVHFSRCVLFNVYGHFRGAQKSSFHEGKFNEALSLDDGFSFDEDFAHER